MIDNGRLMHLLRQEAKNDGDHDYKFLAADRMESMMQEIEELQAERDILIAADKEHRRVFGDIYQALGGDLDRNTWADSIRKNSLNREELTKLLNQAYWYVLGNMPDRFTEWLDQAEAAMWYQDN
jgi:hypothetical protein